MIEKLNSFRFILIDASQIAKNVGTVTLAHFGRILKFLGIVLGAEEFRLLVKRFAKDAYTINYVAFVKAVDEVQCYLEEYGMMDLSGVLSFLESFLPLFLHNLYTYAFIIFIHIYGNWNILCVFWNVRYLQFLYYISQELLDQFPGRIITAELPKLPRPEIGKIMPSQAFGKQTVFHPVMEQTRETMPALEVIKRIQRHILEHRIRIHEFFKVITIQLHYVYENSTYVITLFN